MKTLVRCFWIFLFGSFIGCLIEEAWCLIRHKCFQIRSSLIHLPLIPIYGIAALFIIVIADVVGYNLWKVFLIGSIIATLVEYGCSYVQEKIFHTKSWDYSNFKFNLNGRVNLLYSVAFGLFSVLLIKQIKWLVYFIENHFSSTLFYYISLIVFIFFIIDVIISGVACYRYRKRKEGFKATNFVENYFDRRYPDKRIDKIYNNSVYVG